MEESAINSPDIPSPDQLKVSEFTRKNFKEISQWTIVFSILGFVFIGIMIIGGFFLGTYITKLSGQEESLPFPGYFFGIIYAFMAAIYFPPVLFLYKFTRSIRKSIGENSSAEMDQAFQNLKSHYRYIGILTSIMLIIYVMAGIILAIVSIFIPSGGTHYV